MAETVNFTKLTYGRKLVAGFRFLLNEVKAKNLCLFSFCEA